MENKSRLKVLVLVAVVLAIAGLGYLKYTDVQAPGTVYNFPCSSSTNIPPCNAGKESSVPGTPPPVTSGTSSNPEQSGQIDEHLFVDNTLRDVNFCGKTYKVKQIIIDGVDVVQRIAEIATKNLVPKTLEKYPYPADVAPRISGQQLALQICDYIQNKTTDGVIKVKSNGKYNGAEFELLNDSVYVVGIINSNFVIDNSNNLIYIYGGINLEGTGYTAGLEGPIGKLK